MIVAGDSGVLKHDFPNFSAHDPQNNGISV